MGGVEAGTAREASPRTALLLAGTAVAIYIADQVTKALVVATLPFGARQEVIGDVVQLWHVRNTGAAFSLFPGATWLFMVVTAGALVMIAWCYRAFRTRGVWIHVILGAVLGGTLGNLTDRLRYGYVVDFLSVGVGELRWPTFNVADSALVVGIGLLVIYLTWVDGRRDAAAA